MATGKKIAVVCTGAVGGYAGAHMVQAGEDVTFIDFWPEHVEHMKQHGLTITHMKEVEPSTVPVRALHVTELQQLSKQKLIDVAFVCTKSYDTVFRVGEVHGRITDRAKEVCGLLANADSAFVTENIWGERWSKLVTNVMGNGLSACTGLIGREVVKNDVIRHFSNRLGSEAI